MKKILFFALIISCFVCAFQAYGASKVIRGVSIDFVPGFGKPLPATMEVKSKNPNDVIFKGSLEWLGYARQNNAFFVYYRPGWAFERTKDISINGKGEFISESIKLSPNTYYCYFAVAQNGREQSTGGQQCFTTDSIISGSSPMAKGTLPNPVFLSNDKSLPLPTLPDPEEKKLKSVLDNRLNILPPQKNYMGYLLQMQILDLDFFKGSLPFFELAKKDDNQRYFLNFKTPISSSKFSAYLSSSFPLKNYDVFGGAIKGDNRYYGNIVIGGEVSGQAGIEGKKNSFYYCRIANGSCDKTEQFASKDDCEKYLSEKEVDVNGKPKTPGICHSTQLSCDLTCEGYKPKTPKSQECYKGVYIYYNADGSATTKGFQTAGTNDEIRYASPEMAQESIEIFFKQGKVLTKEQCSDPKDPKGTWYFCVKNTGRCRATFGVKNNKGIYQPYATKEACEANVKKWWGANQTNVTCYSEKTVCESVCNEYTNSTLNKLTIITAGGEAADNNKFRIWYNLVSLGSDTSVKVWARVISSGNDGRATNITTEQVELKDKRLDYFEIAMPTPRYNVFTYEVFVKGAQQEVGGGMLAFYTGGSGTSCGNDLCENGENPQNCPQDCRIPFDSCYAFMNQTLISSDVYKPFDFVIKRPVSQQLIIDSMKNGWQKYTSTPLWGRLVAAPAGPWDQDTSTENNISEITVNPNLSAQFLAMAFYRFTYGSSQQNVLLPLECDITFSDSLANENTKFRPIFGVDETQATVIHEMGHCLNMGDLYDLSLIKDSNGNPLKPNLCAGELCFKNCPEEVMNHSWTIGAGDRAGLWRQFPKK